MRLIISQSLVLWLLLYHAVCAVRACVVMQPHAMHQAQNLMKEAKTALPDNSTAIKQGMYHDMQHDIAGIAPSKRAPLVWNKCGSVCLY